MITLKKSFELQNYLKSIYDKALSALLHIDNITTTKQIHMRSKAYNGGIDEEIIKPKPIDYPFTVMQIVDFANDIQKNMEALTIAINNAKHSADVDFDSMVSVNNHKRQLLNRLKMMADVKPSEAMTVGQSMKFNEEGNQVKYQYDIKEIITIDFDRDAIKAIIRRLHKETDETSTAIDLMQLNTQVDFDTMYEIGDSFEDAVLKYIDR